MTESTSEQAARAGFFRPGNIVKLREPYKPADNELLRWAVAAMIPPAAGTVGRVAERRSSWEAWGGLTHGVIVEIVGTVDGTIPRVVSVHLYDPVLGLVLMGSNAIPMYFDCSIEELIPWAEATTMGYRISDWAIEDPATHTEGDGTNVP